MAVFKSASTLLLFIPSMWTKDNARKCYISKHHCTERQFFNRLERQRDLRERFGASLAGQVCFRQQAVIARQEVLDANSLPSRKPLLHQQDAFRNLPTVSRHPSVEHRRGSAWWGQGLVFA